MRFAKLVFDGVNDIIIPDELGVSNANQNQGTPFEKLGELASRICYDSYGKYPDGKPKGRASNLLHKHILEVKNYSVYEHINTTIGIYQEGLPAHCIYRSLLNRKGVHIELPDDGSVQITYNPRVLLDWVKNTTNTSQFDNSIFLTLYKHLSDLCPQILRPIQEIIGIFNYTHIFELNKYQQHISIYGNSRSWSHEQVRHRFAMSQRSTRYVDESESEYVPNPIIEHFLNDPNIEALAKNNLRFHIEKSESYDKQAYDVIVAYLEDYLKNKGLLPVDTKKQARGAARDYLANALFTEMIFTTNIIGWQWILENRFNEKADSRMRFVYNEVLTELKESIHGHYFNHYKVKESSDGIGLTLA